MVIKNLAIQSYGDKVSKEILLKFVESYNLPVVSVGSGSASLEYKVHQKNKTIRWVCIDPEPTSWCTGEVMIQPSYASVEELVKAEPEIVGRCVLFLNWCLPNKSRYDYDAVILLKPVAFLSTVEFFKISKDYIGSLSPNGAAGGKLFHDLIKDPDLYGYTFCFCSSLYYDYTSDPTLDICFVWHQKTVLPELEIDLEWSFPCQISHSEVCVIC